MGETGESYKPSFKDRLSTLFKGKSSTVTEAIIEQPVQKNPIDNPPQEKSLDEILGELESFKQKQAEEDKKRSEILRAAKSTQDDQTQKAKSALDDYYNNMGINSSQKK